MLGDRRLSRFQITGPYQGPLCFYSGSFLLGRASAHKDVDVATSSALTSITIMSVGSYYKALYRTYRSPNKMVLVVEGSNCSKALMSAIGH